MTIQGADHGHRLRLAFIVLVDAALGRFHVSLDRGGADLGLL